MNKHKTGSTCLIVLVLTIIIVNFQPTLAESSDHDTLIISAGKTLKRIFPLSFDTIFRG